MLMIIISRSGLKLDHVRSKTRSLGQISEKPYVHYGGHGFDSQFMKLYQNVNDYYIKVKLGSKTWVKN